jgi:hypothetical protein
MGQPHETWHMAKKKVDEWEVSGFGIVEDDKLFERHQVAYLETYNRRRATASCRIAAIAARRDPAHGSANRT